MDWRCRCSSRAPALQVRSPELQSHQKKKRIGRLNLLTLAQQWEKTWPKKPGVDPANHGWRVTSLRGDVGSAGQEWRPGLWWVGSSGPGGKLFYFLVGLGFEVRASHLQSSHSNILLCLFWRWVGFLSNYLPGLASKQDPPNLSLRSS
jgi:hypothetical protein